MSLKEGIKKILKDNVCYISEGDSIDEDTDRDNVAVKIMQLIKLLN